MDDFYILSNNKQILINCISKIKSKLLEIGIKLHPNKIYLQNINKGVKFIGGIVKPNRTYVSNRTVGNLKQFLFNLNSTFEEDCINKETINRIVNTFNSYMGFMKHHKSYNIRRKIIYGQLLKLLYTKCYFNKRLTKMIPFYEYSFYNKGLFKTGILDYPTVI